MIRPQTHQRRDEGRGVRKANNSSQNPYLSALRELYSGNPASDFADVARRSGLLIEGTAIGDGIVHRVHVDGDKRGTRNGWYVLHLDGIAAGAFSSWRTGVVETWRAGYSQELSPAERARLAAGIEQARRVREGGTRARWERARDIASSKWQAAAAAHPTHPYLATKCIGAHGIRQSDTLLLVPMRDGEGALWNLQTIAGDGTKRFQFGGRKTGLYHSLGGPVTNALCLAEGYATAASIHAVMKQPVAVAFDCGNMEAVARVLRGKYPGARITICADNDLHTPGNPGLSKATAAALAINAAVAIPPNDHNDFNDAARAEVKS